MSSEFVDPGFVDVGFVTSAIIGLEPGYHLTDFREYRRGRLAGDFIETWNLNTSTRIEGACIDLAHRNYLRLSGINKRTAFLWSAPDLDAGHENQEILCRFRVIARDDVAGSAGVFLLLRASGTIDAENAYRALIATGPAQQLRLDKLVAGTPTVLDSTPKTLADGVRMWARFRANGTTLSLKQWNYGDAEPGAWEVTSTDASLDDGGMGPMIFFDGDVVEVEFFSVATNGQTARDDSYLPEPFDLWSMEPDEEWDFTVRLEYYNPNTNTVQEIWLSRYGRLTGPSDYPPSTRMLPLIEDLGSHSSRLESDTHLGGAAAHSNAPLKFHNMPLGPDQAGLLDTWLGYSFYGRPIEIRAGKLWQTRPSYLSDGVLSPHRRFEIIRCASPSQEPEVTTEHAIVPLSSVSADLSTRLHAYTNIGIPTGVKALTSSGWLSIPNNAAYNVNAYTVYLRVYIPSSGVTGTTFSTLTRRGTAGGTDWQWQLALYHASAVGGHANRIAFNVFATDATQLCAVEPFTLYNLGRWVDIFFGVRGQDRWYLYIDGMKVGGGTGLTKDPANPSLAVEVLRASSGLIVCDHRIEQYVTEDEALARFASRREPDFLTLSMHRCDDNAGSTVTDYATLANHGTLQGVDAVDRIWAPTYLGTPELAGVSMPLSGGVLFHAPTQSSDLARGIFRYNDRSPSTGAEVQVRSRGDILIGGGTDYTEPAEGQGTIDAVAAIDQPVTHGLIVDTPESPTLHVAYWLQSELIARQAATPSTLDTESFLGLRQSLPFKGGFQYAEPPTVSTFLSEHLGPLGSHFRESRDGRITAGIVAPPINPGPYGQEPMLEFLGLPNRGVTFSPNPIFDLDDQLVSGSPWFGLAAWIKLPFGHWTDSSAQMGTYFPAGMTIIDRSDSAAGEGYYLGIDGRDGSIVFGAPGVVGDTSTLHYLSYQYHFQPNEPYFIFGYQDFNTRMIGVYSFNDIGVALTQSKTEFTTGAMTPATSTPLRIGHGPQGSFVGWIGQVLGSSSALGQNDFVDITAPDAFNIRTTRWTQASVSADRWTRTRYQVLLTEGRGDIVRETKSGYASRLDGVRWSPRATLDFRSVGPAHGDPDKQPYLTGVSRPIPAWRVRGEYSLNRQIMSDSDLVAGISDSDRSMLGLGQLSLPVPDLNLKDKYRNSLDVLLKSPLLTVEDVAKVIDIIKTRLGRGRLFANANDWYRWLLRLHLTDELLIYHGRYSDMNDSDGKPMRVVLLEAKLQDLAGDIGLWG